MADGFGLREQLDARIASARRSLFWPALISAIGPVAIWSAAFVILWLTGLQLRLPLEAQAAIGLLFWGGLIVSIWLSWHRWRAPSDQDARDMIDDAIEGRPLNVWVDRPARADTLTWRLWQEHRDRMAALAAKLGRLDVAPYWKRADKYWLRLVVPGLVIAAAVFANVNAPERLRRGAFPDFGALFGAHKLTTEAWITPPTYTGSAPFILTSGQMAKAPEGSEITLRVISPGRPTVKVMPAGKLATEFQLRPGIDGAYEARVKVDRNMRVAVNFWGERASFPFTVIDDATPKAEFVTPPKLGDGDQTQFEWKVSDDYGVTKLELVARMAKPPKGAEKMEDVTGVEVIGLDPKEETGKFAQDLVRNRWAGLDVMLKLRATDASGAYGESAEVAYHLPEKIFLQPNARAAQEIRASILREWRPYADPPKGDSFARVQGQGLDRFAPEAASRLLFASEGVKRAAMMIDAITYQAQDYFEDPIIFMGFRHVRAMLDAAQNQGEAEATESMLWDIALRAEYGSVADARAALDAARRALEEALRNGASEEDIKRLMDMYQQAVENYMAAKMAEAIRNGRMTEGGDQQQGQGGMQMGDDEMQRMLDALRDLAETGATEQARQLLADMQRMLDRMENMQLNVQRGGGGQQQNGPMSRALNRALQDTNRALNDQRDLNDATEQAQRQGGGAQRGQQLADRQRSLRERLEQQMQSGGGQPQQGQQQGQGQGQQGQGQQGQGQQGQGQQGQGQGQQRGQQGQGGQGQGQPGQQGQGQTGPGQGQQGGPRDQPGPGGGIGRPGVNADGRFGQENERTRQLLGRALDFQKRAEQALRNGDFEAARQAQSEAMAALQSRSGELARLADEADPTARQDRNERDILGRLNAGESGYGEDVKIPSEMERQKARDVLNEIRRRLGMRTLKQDEQDYLRRLLDRF